MVKKTLQSWTQAWVTSSLRQTTNLACRRLGDVEHDVFIRKIEEYNLVVSHHTYLGFCRTQGHISPLQKSLGSCPETLVFG